MSHTLLTTLQRIALFAVATIALASCGEQALGDGITDEPLDATVEVLADGFVQPFAIAVIGEDEYLVTERVAGLYYYLNGELTELGGVPTSEIFDSRGTIVGGMMDVSLHPDFDSNGLVYLTYLNEQNTMSVARFDFSTRVVQDAEVIFESDQGSIGSVIAWEDSDHFFVTQGVTQLEAGQDLSHDGGTIHRFAADGSIPEDNPVFGGNEPTSVWSYGHRANQGLVIDEGILYATEHGDNAGDEFNIIESGGNYGWPNITSGRLRDSPSVPTADEAALAQAIDPAVTWPTATLAPTGLTRVGNSSFEELDEFFLFGALIPQALMSLDIETGQTAVILDDVGRVRDIDQLPSGDLIMVVESPPNTPPNGEIIRLSPAS